MSDKHPSASPKSSGDPAATGTQGDRRWILTLSAVLAFPARVADFLATLSAGEVTKGIIPGAAEDRATFSVVVLVTHKAIGVLEVSAAAAVQVLGPLLTHCQVSLGGQAADEALRVLCVKVERSRVIGEPEAGRARGGGLWWEGNCRGRMTWLHANRLASLATGLLERRMCYTLQKKGPNRAAGLGLSWGKVSFRTLTCCEVVR